LQAYTHGQHFLYGDGIKGGGCHHPQRPFTRSKQAVTCQVFTGIITSL